jgi:hypothetical protein
METEYTIKSDPNLTFQLTTEPFHSWAIELYDIMQEQPFKVHDVMNALGLNGGDEAMSLLTYMYFDLKCIKPFES